jgi:uroporphyrinogen decarboxylase
MTIGADAYHFGEATDLVKVMAMVPSNTFILGNISPSKLFQNGTPERIYEATTQLLLSCWQYDHFILSSGCDIPPSAPIENIDSFFKAIHDFKK